MAGQKGPRGHHIAVAPKTDVKAPCVLSLGWLASRGPRERGV